MKMYDIDVYRMSTISDDTEADLVLTDLKDILTERDRLIDTVNEQIRMLTDRIESIKIEFSTKTRQHENLLKQYLNNVEMRETKTKKSYRLPTATLTVKKPDKSIFIDGDKLLDFVKRVAPHHIKLKTTESVDWANMKASCMRNDEENAFDLVTAEGELVRVEGVALVDTGVPQVNIKFEDGETYDTQEDPVY